MKVPQTRDELQRLSETLNKMLARLEASLEQIRRFTADASHELRAPLTLIRTAAEFSLRRDRSHEDLIDAMGKILRESERTTRLVEGLLLLSRADSGLSPLELAPMDLCEAVREAVDPARVLSEAKSISLAAVFPAGALEIEGDFEAVRRAVYILLDNAVKYTPESGAISVRLSSDGAKVQLSVRDTGIGIAPEDLPHIFDRFWRADKARSRQRGGVGLGLSIAHWVAQSHGGSIRVTSKFGEGSEFLLEFPVSSRR